MRQLVFGKPVQCARGSFAVGDALPAHLAVPETIKQFREQFGQDVLIESREMAQSLQEIVVSLRRIEDALGLKAQGKSAKKSN